MSGSVYLAMGAPFLTFSLLMIFRERYLEKLYCMDPSCWLLGQGYWGEDQRGLWLFLILLAAALAGLHGAALEWRLREI